MDENLIDFYAGLAMMGLLASGRDPAYSGWIVEASFDMADAMLEKRTERAQRKESEVNGQ